MNDIPIENHSLSHIPELTVDPEIFQVRFRRDCTMIKCSAACCKYGVWADVLEQKNILDHTELIQRYMEPDMEKNPAGWFDDEIKPDSDYVSGKVIGTAVRDNGCVFLTHNGLCILQKIEMEEKDPSLKLKPFYCKAFPIAIEHGRVIYDDYMKDTQPQCCSPVAGGDLDVFDVCGEELELVLGKDGLNELREKAQLISEKTLSG
ncbi:MAG: DUF3109 family protein [Bacteroidota bacterium]